MTRHSPRKQESTATDRDQHTNPAAVVLMVAIVAIASTFGVALLLAAMGAS